MTNQKLKLWTGIGVATLLASSGAMADEHKDRQHDDGMTSGSHGGEGGEGGENHGEAGAAFSYFAAGGEGGEGGEAGGAVSAADSDGAYVAMLQMMQGHLMAARELIKSGKAADGRPHLTHPWVEIYPMAEAGLESRGQKELGNHLKALAENAGQVENWGDVSQEFQAAWMAIQKAEKSVEGRSAASVSKVVLSLTKQAVLEYDGALENGRFVAEHEYQDGRGFVRSAREYLNNHQVVLKKRNKEAWRDAGKALDEMLKAWPTAVPPEQPVIPVANLYAAQARLELALAPYLY
ncbi:hypothetical protein [Marinobacter metalliresistant]|uniref:Uncharacterized protein n=1 Tax=Marinobacter metalliresistant TaxID=2961995 RepID=A0ABZ2VY76_9GAMM